jgi:hypothetical protein
VDNTTAASLLSRMDLGTGVAETDELLEAARIETSVFDDLLGDRVDLIPGTKGSGKTALYRIFTDFLPKLLLTQRRVVVAHGVKGREDTVFLAYKTEFDRLSEADFVDFWCVYLASLANEQFVVADGYSELLRNAKQEVQDFRRAYRNANIPDLDRKRTLKEIVSWALSVVKRLKPKVTWKAPENIGQFELELGGADSEVDNSTGEAKLPLQINEVSAALERVLEASDLALWLMVDRLDELFARRSPTERRALRGLLTTMRLFSTDHVRIKVFLRDDILEQIVEGEGFTALSHVAARRSDTLRWSEDQILAMVVRRIYATEEFRTHFDVDFAKLGSGVDYQSRAFYKIFVDKVHRGPNQSPTLRWIYNHTRDGRGVVTPRDVIRLVTSACQRQRDMYRKDPEGTTERLITGGAIRYGLEELSKDKRTLYLEAEFPHKWQEIRKLVGGGAQYSEKALRRIFGKNWQDTVDDLVSMGVLERVLRKGEPTLKIPFLYRDGLECTQTHVAS